MGRTDRQTDRRTDRHTSKLAYVLYTFSTAYPPSSKEHRTFYLTKDNVEGYWSVALSAGTTTEVVSRELLIDSTARLDASSKNCSLHK